MLGIAYFLKTDFNSAPTHKKIFKQTTAFAVFALAFALGAILAQLASPISPNNYPALQNTLLEYKKPLSITATVSQVEGMPDARLRIILQDVEIQIPNKSKDDFADAESETPQTKDDGDIAKTGQAGQTGQTEEAEQAVKSNPLKQTNQNKPNETTPGPTILKLPNNLAWTWKFPTSLPLPGQRIAASLRINPIHGMFNPGVFNIEDYWAEKDVAWRAWSDGEKASYQVLQPAPFWQEARANIHTKLSANLQDAEGKISKGKAVILALLMGDRYYLNSEDMDLFAAASLSHSLALSGLHLGLMAALGTSLAFLLCRLRPSVMLYIPRPKLIVLFSAPLVLIYLWLGGITPSLTRAALMFACWGVLLLRGRQHVLMDGLFWAILLILVVNPLALHDLRLQLSAISVAAIALCLPASVRLAQKICTRQGPLGKIMRAGISLLVVSASIQLALLPIQVENFGQATPWFVLNLIWLPVLSSFVFPLAIIGLGLCLVPPLEFIARWVFDLAALPVDALFTLLTKLDKLDLLVAPVVARPLPAASLAYWALFLLLVAMLSKYATRNQHSPLNSHAQGAQGGKNPPPQKIANLKSNNSFLFSLKNAWSQSIPLYTSTPKISLAMFCILFCAWGLIAFCLLERWQAENPASLRLRLLDVGQGQAVLIEGANGARILIDGGGLPGSNFDVGKNIIAPVLTLNRAPRLSAAINTHPDHDHLGGMIYLFNKFKIDHVYLGQGLPQGTKGKELELLLRKRGFEADLNAPPLRAGQYLALDAKHGLQVIHPLGADLARADLARANLPGANSPGADLPEPHWAEPVFASNAAHSSPQGDAKKPNQVAAYNVSDKEINNQSLVVRLIVNSQGAEPKRSLALNCGDIYLPGIEEMLARVPHQLSSQVLILPHHGSEKSFSPEFYDAVKPEFALVSTGFNNAWGFPSKEVRDELLLRHVPLYNTAELGQIIIEWDEGYEAKLTWAR